MKCTTVIDPAREEELLIYAHERTPLVDELERLASTAPTLIGYDEGHIATLSPAEVCCVYTEEGRVYACTEHKKWQLRTRLYTLEAELGQSFIRINQSCLVNRAHIVRFETAIGGALRVVLCNGYRDYVSRRQLKTVKERIGFRL